MSYATKQNLIDRYSEAALLLVAALASDASQLDDDAIALAISDADAVIDANVRGRYAVPLSPVPAEIVGISCALARYALHENATSVPDQVKTGRDNAMALLAAIRDGDAVLDCAPAPSSDPAATAQAPEFASDEPVMTRDKLASW